ncbi:MAG: ATP-binding protein [Clostridia bacterium]|jgi:two-component system sensor histidine kinase VicK|nr:HAMP domain-containing protein [Clostridia bacterium]MDO4382518.1 ATP-binding protein [Clostridia bacterium]MEE0790225.1 ATP-binding protein [Clostridia bacterium]HCF65734.1 PAS domain-containing sensor histidine kinase [Clostridiales bacterium]HJJ10131.1 cell wall metabolism sensor histidine kinase WalK [Clostridiaceae bacterium]
MTKNIQFRILLIFLIIGIAFIVGISCYSISILENLKNMQNQVELQQNLTNQIENLKSISAVSLGTFFIIILIMGIFISKSITKPITKLIKSVEKITAGEDVKLESENGTDTQIGELVNAFTLMTNELKQNINEIERQKKQIETILLHMTDGVIAFNMEGKIIHINTAAMNLLKLEQKDNSFEKIFNKLKLNINLEKIIYLENWTSSEHRLTIEDKCVNLFFVPFQDENNRQAGLIVVIQDITEHVKLDNMRKEFVADVSHELKTPITSIMGYADTLLEGEYDKDTQQKFLGVISSEARRMARLVTDLLTLSKYDSKKVKLEETEFDLGELTKKCQERLKFEIEKKHQNVECFVTANVPPVSADKYGIERVVLNILSNAIKYTPENGKIKIYVGFVYNDAYIKIIDNGIGISEQDLTRIFDRFYRADKARTREMGGTGLGLSIAKEILDQNKGSIDIRSELGKGTEVIIRIPAKK